MNRKHTVDDYFKIVDKIRNVRPDIAMSSDFIVGFPDETDEDFEKTMQFIEKIKFVIAYSSFIVLDQVPQLNIKILINL